MKPQALSLPDDSTRCVHISVSREELAEGWEVKTSRCTNEASSLHGHHGWLCLEHDNYLNTKPGWMIKKTRTPPDQDHVQSIIALENRAISQGRRVNVVAYDHGIVKIVYLT